MHCRVPGKNSQIKNKTGTEKKQCNQENPMTVTSLSFDLYADENESPLTECVMGFIMLRSVNPLYGAYPHRAQAMSSRNA